MARSHARRTWGIGLLCLSLGVAAGYADREQAVATDSAEDSATGPAPDPSPDPSLVPPVVWMLPPIAAPHTMAQSPEEMRPYTETIPGTDVGFEMVPVPGGQFTIGSPDTEPGHKADEGPRRQLTVEPFWMGKCEVTWDEYELWGVGLDVERRHVLRLDSTEYDQLADAITMPSKPYADMTFGMGKSGYPAISMTQLAAKMYCKWLTAKTGRYYRLPTEAEWEYACRAGTTTAYGFGDAPEPLEEYAWYFDNSDDTYHRVGEKQPNAWGLHDMHGNVAEWVLDAYSPDGYPTASGKAARGHLCVPSSLYPRVVRGGSWLDDADVLRSAARRASSAAWQAQDPQIPKSVWYHTDADFVGFRVLRPLRVPASDEARRYDVDDEQKRVFRQYREARGF